MTLCCARTSSLVKQRPRSSSLVARARRKVAPVARPGPTRLPKRLVDESGLSVEEYMAMDGDDGDLAERPRSSSLVARARRKVAPVARPGPTRLPKRLVDESGLSVEEYMAMDGDDGDLAEVGPDHRSGFVAIVGRPNAGKSSLSNALVGQKLSSVTAKAQTTRHRLMAIVSEPDFQLVLVDTPGILKSQTNELDTKMMGSVASARRQADALLAIIDSVRSPEEAAEELQLISDAKPSLPTALVLNKVDVLKSELEVARLQAWFQEKCAVDVVLPTSALTGRGVEEVKHWAAAQLPLGPSLYPQEAVSQMPERFYVAEIIQEKMFKQYREEIPYSTTVQVTAFRERPGDKDLIEVDLIVEANSQKGIVIGKGASALKQLGMRARADIEAFLEREVHLELSVRVQPKWRKSSASVTKYGY